MTGPRFAGVTKWMSTAGTALENFRKLADTLNTPVSNITIAPEFLETVEKKIPKIEVNHRPAGQQ